jgi:DNA polymerase I-like protein with 3'-5' exonuclease and polymerase domains
VPPGSDKADVYLGIAFQLGFLRESMDLEEREALRNLFKTVVLGIQYGLGWRSLAVRTGISGHEAREILRRLRARFHRFEAFCASVLDHAGLDLEIGTPYGWYMQCPPGMNPRTIRNFPIQSIGSEILHVACLLAKARGIDIVAPVHDALMGEGSLSEMRDFADALDVLMRDAAEIVLRGYRLPTDEQIIVSGDHYKDKRGKAMWDVVTKLMAKLEREVA